MDYQKQKSQEHLMFMYVNSGQNKHSTDEKEKKLTQIILEKRIFCQKNSDAPVANKITASHKKWCAHIETVFNGNSKRVLLFFGLWKNLTWYHDFLGRWEKPASWKMKTASHFPNHNVLIRTLQ